MSATMSDDTYVAEIIGEVAIYASTSLALGLFALIWTYLSRKPLGMQTPFDAMVKDYIVVSTVSTLVGDMFHLGHGPYTRFPYLAVISCLVQIGLGHAYFLQALATVSTRYILIFCSSWIEQVNDHTYVNGIRAAIVSTSCILTTYEALVNDYANSQTYAYLTGINKDHSRPLTIHSIKVVVLLGVLLIIIMFVRIEIWKWQSKEKSLADIGYSFFTIRSIGLIMLLGGLSTVVYIDQVSSPRLKRIKFHAFYIILVLNILPIWMIVRNENMAAYVTGIFQTFVALIQRRGSRVGPL